MCPHCAYNNKFGIGTDSDNPKYTVFTEHSFTHKKKYQKYYNHRTKYEFNISIELWMCSSRFGRRTN